MSGHADTIRRALEDHAPPRDGKPGCTYCQGALAALAALVVEQADRIAWLEGEVAGWRIKLAAAQDALERIAHGYDGDEFQDSADACERHIDIARAALDGTPSEDA